MLPRGSRHVDRSVKRSRRRSLLLGSPALVLGVLAFGVVFYSARSAAADPSTYFLRLAAEYADNTELPDDERLTATELCYERAIDSGGEVDRARFALAKALIEAGKNARALEMMRSLAPEKVLGYGPAHRWMGAFMLRGGTFNARALARAEVHLRRAIEVAPDDGQAHQMLIHVFLRRKDYPRALPHVAKAWELGEITDLSYLQFYANWISMTDPEDAFHATLVTESRALAGDLEARSIKALEKAVDDHSARMAVAFCRVVLGDKDQAVEVLAAGIERWPSYVRYRDALAHVYLLQALELGMHGEKGKQRTQILVKAVELQPMKLSALRELVRAELAGDALAVDTLRRIIEAAPPGQRGVYGALYLGSRAYSRALPLLELAYAVAGPYDPSLGNNLALCLIEKPEPDAARALKVVDLSIKRWPKIMKLRDTRGRVLIALRRWKEALEDLEVALPSVTDRGGTYEAMARAYRGLGQAKIARRYDRRAQEFARKKAARTKRIEDGWKWADLEQGR